MTLKDFLTIDGPSPYLNTRKGTLYNNAIWGRIRLIPFTVSIPESERIPRRWMTTGFKEKFSGRLVWIIHGCQHWQKAALGTPEEVRQATDRYRVKIAVARTLITKVV